MTAMVDAPDYLDYAEWCYKSWSYWCKKNNVELFILEDELQPKGDGTYKVPGMKPTWQRWHAMEVLDANGIEYDNYRQYNQAYNNLIRENMMASCKKDLKDIPDFEGSPSAKDKITEGIIDLAIGKKPSPNRGAIKKDVRSKNKTDKKARNVQKDLRDIAIKGDKVQAQLKRATATMAGIKSRRQKRQPKNETTDAVKIQTLINKRLPAEVRRNMGRPALINRTGRFSNSVELTSLKPTPLGFAGDYTYQLSPYETFENTGDRKWPTGYNPKPLIAKSIRNLAEQYTVQRFTILRRR